MAALGRDTMTGVDADLRAYLRGFASTLWVVAALAGLVALAMVVAAVA